MLAIADLCNALALQNIMHKLSEMLCDLFQELTHYLTAYYISESNDMPGVYRETLQL